MAWQVRPAKERRGVVSSGKEWRSRQSWLVLVGKGLARHCSPWRGRQGQAWFCHDVEWSGEARSGEAG